MRRKNKNYIVRKCHSSIFFLYLFPMNVLYCFCFLAKKIDLRNQLSPVLMVMLLAASSWPLFVGFAHFGLLN